MKRKTAKGHAQGRDKVLIHLQDLIKRIDFQKDVAFLRDRFDIPENGYAHDWEKDSCPHTPPEAWLKEPHSLFRDKNVHFMVMEEIGLLFAKYYLDDNNAVSYSPLEAYIFYNHIPESELYLQSLDLCYVEDVTEKNYHKTSVKIRNSTFPISLRISPSASGRDVSDFIEKNFEKHIAPLCKKHKKDESELGKKKKKNKAVQERDAFIYDCWKQEMSLKQIGRAGYIKYGLNSNFPDQGYISKIISKEKRSRRDV